MLYGKSVILRGMTAADIDYLAAYDQEPEVAALTGGRYPSREGCAATEPQLGSRTHRRWVIMTRDQQVIGGVELAHILWHRHEAELAICIARKEYWGCGLGTDAIRTLLCYAFGELNLNCVYLRVFGDNVRAIRAYERCGFRRSGAIQLAGRHGQARQVVLMTVERKAFDLVWQLHRDGSSHDPTV